MTLRILTNEQLRAHIEWANRCDKAYSSIISLEPSYRRFRHIRALAHAKAARLERIGASPARIKAARVKAELAGRLMEAYERSRLADMGLWPFIE